MGYMGSVFYAKLCNDTTFFYGLATKKTMINNCFILVRSLKSLDAMIISTPHPQQPITHSGRESSFVCYFVTEQQSWRVAHN